MAIEKLAEVGIPRLFHKVAVQRIVERGSPASVTHCRRACAAGRPRPGAGRAQSECLVLENLADLEIGGHVGLVKSPDSPSTARHVNDQPAAGELEESLANGCPPHAEPLGGGLFA